MFICRCLNWLSRPASRRPSRSFSQKPSSLDLEQVAALIKRDDAQVVVMAGAGISVAAGIPDFRTPGSGLYDNLQDYGLPYPEAVFDLGFYQQNPLPFQRLCRELWPGNFAPTLSHAFFKVLNDKGKLRRCFTQNIDSLESAAGLPKDRIVAAHGNFDAAHVVGSGKSVPVEEVRQAAFGTSQDWELLAERHGGLVKPSIVFFGENLPRRFFELSAEDLPQCTVLLVMGTSLAVHPFAGLVQAVQPGTPRYLINKERVGNFNGPADGAFEGDCDEAVLELCKRLGWDSELRIALKQAIGIVVS